MSTQRNWIVTIGALPFLALFGYIAIGVFVISDGPWFMKLIIAIPAAGLAYIAARVALIGTTAGLKRYLNWLF